MKVYRIEHSVYGCGPYVTGHIPWEETEERELVSEVSDDLCAAHSGDPLRPAPCDDVNGWHFGDTRDEMSFGFQHYTDMTRWFDGWIEDLDYAGYVVAIYEVDAEYVMFGRLQVAFEREHAELLTHDPMM